MSRILNLLPANKQIDILKLMFRILLIICFCILSVISLQSCKENAEKKITIATSANMQFVMKKLADDFSMRSNVACDLVIASSGKLTAQITEGAPYHLFVAANTMYPEYIYSQGLAPNPPEIYAYGKLVLWTVDPTITPSLELLVDNAVEKIAIANPQTAPYGEAAIEVLRKNDLFDSVKHKLVYGESVAQTNQFIVTGAATIGFTSLSVVKSELMRGKGQYLLLSEEDYTSIAQGVVLIRTNEEIDKLAEHFYTYLFSEEAGEILEEFGYSRDE